MRFVVTLAIAIATLPGSAMLCWGQIARSDYGVDTVPRSAAYGQAAPRQTPPGSVEGSWVSDDQPAAAPEEMFDAQELTGMPDYGTSSDGGAPNEYGEAEGEACDPDGGCGSPADDYAGTFGQRFGKKLHHCEANDLWKEVHAHRRMWVQADYLSMWAKGNHLPPLVTTSPIGTPQAQAGVLPVSATTSILYGNERVDIDQRNGGRITFGYWLIDGEFLGIEGQ